VSRIAYVNGRYMPLREALVHVEDRGYQFADGVYEVCEIKAGRIVDERLHLKRLERSLAELRIAFPMALAALGVIFREVVRRNRVRDGAVYLQVTRGVAPRNHAFPNPPVRPSVVVTCRAMSRAQGEARAASGVAAVTVPDTRWARVDIKTTGLLPNVLARQTAREAGAYEAIFVDADGCVTEGASTNVWIVTADGALVTRPADRGILRGITRTVLFDLARREGLRIEERRFTLDEALTAREVFLTAATTLVMPVISIDGRPIGSGGPGRVATLLRGAFHSQAEIAPEWSGFLPQSPEKADGTKIHR